MNKQLMKEHIASEFVKMCEEKGIDNVTISKLCEQCEINRGTFYYHFLDVNDLILWIFHENITIPSIKYIDENNDGITSFVLNHLYNNKPFIMQAFGNSNPETEKIFKSESEQIWTHEYEHLIKSAPQLDDSKLSLLKLVITYFSNAHMYAALNWIKEGMKYEPDHFAHALHVASSKGIRATLDELIISK